MPTPFLISFPLVLQVINKGDYTDKEKAEFKSIVHMNVCQVCKCHALVPLFVHWPFQLALNKGTLRNLQPAVYAYFSHTAIVSSSL